MDPENCIRNGFAHGRCAHCHFYAACNSRTCSVRRIEKDKCELRSGEETNIKRSSGASDDSGLDLQRCDTDTNTKNTVPQTSASPVPTLPVPTLPVPTLPVPTLPISDYRYPECRYRYGTGTGATWRRCTGTQWY